MASEVELVSQAPAATTAAVDSSQTAATPAAPETQNGWNADKSRWYDDGVMARDHCFYDPASKAWYWADADGSIAAGKDVMIPKDESDRSKGGKWVRFLEDRTMVKGEDFRYGGWYYFDPVTGEMAKGVKLVPAGQGSKWVYYDWITGKMAHGEAYLSYDAEHTGWYHFDDVTGAMTHGFCHLPGKDGGKWVYYDPTTGIMCHGEQRIDGSWYYLNPATGAVSYGFQNFDGRWLLYDWPSGKMRHGTVSVNGYEIQLDPITGELRTGALPGGPHSPLAPSTSPASGFGSRLSAGQITLLHVFSDSIGAGYGSSNVRPFTSNPILEVAGTTYYEPSHETPCAMNWLGQQVESRGGTFVNASVPGAGSMHLFDRADERWLGEGGEGHVALVMLGLNDRLVTGETIESYEREAGEFVSKLVRRYGQENVYVLSCIPGAQVGSIDSAQIERSLERLCQENGWQNFVPVRQTFELATAYLGLPPEALLADGVHPNDRGQSVLRDVLFNGLGIA